MADFVQTNITKTAVRELAAPIADVAAFNTLVQGVITGNPWSCTAYTSGDVPQDPVAKSREAYTAYILFEDEEANTVGSVTARALEVAGFNAAIAAILADTDLADAIGGDAVRDSDSENYSCTLRCHDASGEVYYVTFSRDQVRITSYSDDAIRTRIETWADTVPALA
jgi:hypothetical protein